MESTERIIDAINSMGGMSLLELSRKVYWYRVTGLLETRMFVIESYFLELD